MAIVGKIRNWNLTDGISLSIESLIDKFIGLTILIYFYLQPLEAV